MKVTSGSDLKPESYQINAKICRLVEKFPCMYDRSHPHYLKKDVVDKAWVKISKEMDDSIPSCKERWRNIRTSFARSINVNKVPASANRTKPYYLHEELQFLARHITPGIPIPRRSNAYSSAGEESEVIEVSVGEDTFDGFVLAHHTDADDERPDGDEEEDDDDEDGSQPEQPASSVEDRQEAAAAAVLAAIKREPSDTPLCAPKKRRRTVDLTPDTAAASASAVAAAGIVEQKFSEQQPTATPDADFDSIFLQGLLPEMKAMDFRQKILFKRRIYEVMSEVFEHPSPLPNVSAAAAGQSQIQIPSAGHPQPPCLAASNVLHAKVSSTPSPGVGVGSAAPTYAPTMTVVNAADLAMIRRLNSLLQSPQGAVNATLTTMAAAPKNLVAASAAAAAPMASTGRTAAAPATATVAVNRGALTRASANLLRVTMVNPPAASAVVPSTPPAAAPTTPVIKQEPEVLDD